jgi:hypothetical protein
MKFAYLTIANNDGVRKAPIGMIDENSKVIGMEFGDAPTITPPTPIAVYHAAHEAPGPTAYLLTAAIGVLSYHLGGPWALIAVALLMSVISRIAAQGWQAAQRRQRGASRTAGRD